MSIKMRLLYFVCSMMFPAAWCLSADMTVIDIVRSKDIDQYNEALEGIERYIEERKASVDLNKYSLEDENVFERIKAQRPDLILALGTSALKTISESVEDIPIVFSVVLLSEENGFEGENVTGASLNIPIKTQLENLRATIPDRKIVGLIYSPDKNEGIVGEAGQMANELGLVLKAFPVKSAKEIPKIRDMKIDALWLIPDGIVCQPAIIKHILSTSLKQKVPVMGISPSYVKAGALLALSCNYEDIGRQSGEIALRILNGERPADIPVSVPRKIRLYLNLAVAERLGVKIPTDIIKDAHEVFGK